MISRLSRIWGLIRSSIEDFIVSHPNFATEEKIYHLISKYEVDVYDSSSFSFKYKNRVLIVEKKDFIILITRFNLDLDKWLLYYHNDLLELKTCI